MALFGSLGKLLGLDSPTGRGFITGFAETGTKILQDDMKNEQERIDRIADYKIKKQEEDQERYQKELRENLEALRNIKGQVGSVSGAEYLVREYGIKGAVDKAKQIETLKGFGITPEFITKDENQTTLDDLARFVTAAPEVAKVGQIKGTGLLSKIGLGADIGADVQQQLDDAASELGYGTVTTPDLGAMPTAKGFDPSDLGMMADFKDEASRQMRLAIAAKEAGNTDLYDVHMSKANKMIGFSRMLDSKATVTEAGSRAFSKLVTGHIGDTAGFNTTYKTNLDGSTSIITNWDNSQDKGKANTTGAILSEIYNTAVNTHGINSATAQRIIFESVQNNKLPVFTQSPDGTMSLVTGTQTLVEGGFKGGKGAYAPPPPPPSTTTTATQGAGTTTQTTSPDVANLISQHNAATSGTTRQVIKGKIARALGVGTIQQIPDDIAGQLN